MDDKTRVLIIGPTPPPHHGVSMAMQALLTSSVATTFRVFHLDITDRRGIGFVDQPDWHDVFLFIRQFFRNLMLIFRERPALLYLPISQTRLGFFRDSLFMLPAMLSGIPVVIHLHGANFDAIYTGSGRFWRAYMEMILRRVARFIVLGETLRPIFSRWAPPERISVVPNGVPLDDDRQRSSRVSSRADGEAFRIVFLSSLSRQKGLFVLLQVMSLIVKVHPDVELLIAGPWWGETTRQEAESCIAASGISDKVRFVGAVTGQKKNEFLLSGDVFVFPGVQQEGQPMTVLEAMSEGLPVIATDRGCLRETIIDGVTGYIVPPNSPEAIAEKILYLIRHRALREEMGENALKRVVQCYTIEQFTSRMIGVLRRTLTSASSRSAARLRPDCRP